MGIAEARAASAAVVLAPDERPGGVGGKIFCSSPHPTAEFVWCRRQPHIEGDCSAFVHGIREPETWPNPREMEGF